MYESLPAIANMVKKVKVIWSGFLHRGYKKKCCTATNKILRKKNSLNIKKMYEMGIEFANVAIYER